MTVDYYNAVVQTMGKGVDSSVRLFMVPGMGHCGGGDGPNTFDMIAALEKWREHGHAPGSILASKVADGQVIRTRPLCPYPQVAKYKGTGSIDRAESFACTCPVNGGQLHPSTPSVLLVAALAAWAASPAPASRAVPVQPSLQQLRIIAPAAPGGGWDQTARVMQMALQQAGIVRTAPVENIPGAAGTIGLARFIGAERGNGDAVLVSGLIMLGGIVTNQSPVSLGDVTPLARLTGEYEVIVVPAASPYRSLQELLTRIQGAAGGDLLGRRIRRRQRSDSGRPHRRGRRRLAGARQLHRLLRRRRVAVGHRRRPGLGGDQRARGACGADRGGHGAGAGHLERRASSRSCGADAAGAGSRRRVRELALGDGAARDSIAAERERLEATIAGDGAVGAVARGARAVPLDRSVSGGRRVRPLRGRGRGARARHPAAVRDRRAPRRERSCRPDRTHWWCSRGC